MSDTNMMKVQTQIKQNAEEISSYFSDLAKWEKSIKQKDGQLRGKPAPTKAPRSAPVRPGSGTVQVNTEVAPNSDSKEFSAAKHTYDVGYKKWNDYDVEKELSSVDSAPLAVSNGGVGLESIADSRELTPASIVKTRRVVTTEGRNPLVPPARGVASTRNAEEAERERGNEEFKQGNFHAAVKSYTLCLGLKARNVVAFSNRAMAYIKLKEYSRAELDCNSAIELDPCHVKSYLRRATSRNALGKHRAALSDLERALEQEPTNKQCRVELQKTKELLRNAVNRAPMIAAKVEWCNQDSLTQNFADVSGPDLPPLI